MKGMRMKLPRKIFRIASAIARDEEGATMIEYALMLALIAIICFGAVQLVGTNTSNLYNDSADKIQAATAS